MILPAGAARRDEGAVLPLVLVMMVIAALIVIPLLGYSVSVLRANQVVSDSSRDREAAEGGLRIALLEPTGLFNDCIGASKPVAMPADGVVSGRSVSASCALVDEVGPANVLGYENPVSAALQLGATMPIEFLGTVKPPPEVPPYPADERWWDHTVTATDGEIWLPELPTVPGTDRTSAPFDMPAAFGCKVFLPGRYADAVTISSGNVYFASGVYYFEKPVTIEGDANVVVGYGLDELPNGCADDVQVGANLLGPPSVFGIDGAGATWVFGAEGRLVVDNKNTNSGLSLRFNQRYVQTGYEAERGQRISIISVNGDDNSSADHDVPRVVSVPRSTVAVDGTSTPLGGTGAAYLPSKPALTSEARTPLAPAGLGVIRYVDPAQPSTSAGVLRVEWDEVTGQAAGGALIDGYSVSWTSNAQSTRQWVCTDAESIVVVDDPGDGAPRRLGCAIRGLRTNSRTYRIRVAAHNDAGHTSPEASLSNITFPAGTLPVAAPVEPTIDTVIAYDGAAEISWTPGADNGAPITSYAVRAERVHLAPQVGTDDDGQPLPPVEQYEPLGGCATTTELWQPAATSCIIEGLPDLPEGVDPDTGDEILGYRFVITATNAIGGSAEHVHTPAPAVFSFDGDPVPPPSPPVDRVVEPWIPTPIVDLQVGGSADTTVTIPGYIAVPMGRISVDNPEQHTVKLIGGLLASTFWLDEATADGVANSAGLGYQSDIVLQRKIRLVSTAGSAQASAIVQINEDGNFAVNSWVVR